MTTKQQTNEAEAEATQAEVEATEAAAEETSTETTEEAPTQRSVSAEVSEILGGDGDETSPANQNDSYVLQNVARNIEALTQQMANLEARFNEHAARFVTEDGQNRFDVIESRLDDNADATVRVARTLGERLSRAVRDVGGASEDERLIHDLRENERTEQETQEQSTSAKPTSVLGSIPALQGLRLAGSGK